MADINLVGPAERDLHTTRSGNVKVAYLVERDIDLEHLAEVKGSALASGDVVTALKLPAQSVVVGAYVAVDKKLSDAAATVDVDAGAESLITAAAVGAAVANSVVEGASPAPVVVNSDTSEVTVTLTGVTASAKGSFRVAIEVLDLSKARRPGIAQLGS